MKNPFGKTRSEDKPYATYINGEGWRWKVLKTYKHPDNEKKDPNARWFVSATSPYMHNGSYEMGDTYVADIAEMCGGSLTVLDCVDEWKEMYKSHLKWLDSPFKFVTLRELSDMLTEAQEAEKV
jgi:hypothetical protein